MNAFIDTDIFSFIALLSFIIVILWAHCTPTKLFCNQYFECWLFPFSSTINLECILESIRAACMLLYFILMYVWIDLFASDPLISYPFDFWPRPLSISLPGQPQADGSPLMSWVLFLPVKRKFSPCHLYCLLEGVQALGSVKLLETSQLLLVLYK